MVTDASKSGAFGVLNWLRRLHFPVFQCAYCLAPWVGLAIAAVQWVIPLMPYSSANAPIFAIVHVFFSGLAVAGAVALIYDVLAVVSEISANRQ